jgi:penicillin-binding protein 1A
VPPVKKKAPVQGIKKTRPVYKKPLNEKHIIGFLFGICLTLTLFIGGLLLILALLKIPDIRTVAEYQPIQASEILDRYGKVITRIYQQNRTVIPLSEMPAYLPQAFVASEDSRFFTHPGLDLWSVFRAAINNLKSGRRAQGGSTITQQVAKSLLLSPEKTYLRKFKEAILAWRIDTLLSKEDILHIYLNQIYLGSGAYGVEAAARQYFDKSARNLSVGEAALLAGLPQAPSRYAPDKHMKSARKRQRYVLNRMVADGYLDASQARKSYDESVQVVHGKRAKLGVNGYFIQLIRKRAEKILGTSLNRAGVKVYTTMDTSLQKKAVKALRSGIAKSFKNKKKVQGAAIIMDAENGSVRALVGGLNFNTSAFDRATQARRSAGSVFKPLLYSAALTDGMSPETTIMDAPFSITGKDGKLWQPRNFSGKHYGETTLREALVYSRNIVSIKLLQKVGIKRMQRLAEQFGVRPPITSDLSLALGATGVSLLDITAAYGPFVTEGKYTAPLFITKITRNSGEIVHRRKTESRQVLDREVAEEIKGMLMEVLVRGTGKRAAGLPGVTGGKTGTTNKNRDAWFVGFRGQLLGGVWVGHDNNTSLGHGKGGGVVAAPIWREFMGGRETN